MGGGGVQTLQRFNEYFVWSDVFNFPVNQWLKSSSCNNKIQCPLLTNSSKLPQNPNLPSPVQPNLPSQSNPLQQIHWRPPFPSRPTTVLPPTTQQSQLPSLPSPVSSPLVSLSSGRKDAERRVQQVRRTRWNRRGSLTDVFSGVGQV